MYHWVDDDLGDKLRLYGVTPSALRSQVSWMKRLGYKSAPLDHMFSGSGRSVVLTFDDGYVDNVENALPILEEAGMTATVFVVTDHAGGVNAWDMHHGDEPRPLLTWEQMRALDGKTLSFEPHSRTHPYLTKLPPAAAREEIVGSKKKLEDELGREARVFSYPHGDHDDAIEGMVREAGFAMAVTDKQGLNYSGDDPIRVRRTMITSRDVAPTFLVKLGLGRGAYDLLGLSR
jgi:peptidoglycan/xylan/chitin deacetylase (PgdA/CDA1 family)